MSILVVGSVALDHVETPFGSVKDALGGSSIYFAAAASYFAPVRIVGVVGDDFPYSQLDFLKKRSVDFQGLETQPGKTFRWGGRYDFDLNSRTTLFTDLNVFEKFKPVIPESYRDSEFVFLGNIAPDLQLDILNQIHSPKLVALDTMNYWIEGSLSDLCKTLRKVQVLLLNDSEARQLAQEPNLVKAARIIRKMGPVVLVIKKGEHGAMMFIEDTVFWAPAFPLETIFDPTGAGDTFAGGFMGYLAKVSDVTADAYRRALIFGSAMASFCVESFSLERLKDLQPEEIRERFKAFWVMTNFDHLNSGF
jgi:sugar/nucleoside kinase (ribokinase family)